MSARRNTPAVLRASIEHIEKVSTWLQRALWGVTGGSLVFTTSTVTAFGMGHGVPWYISWLLEPLVATALIAVLLGDGVLSNYGQKAPGWATFLRWFAGLASWTMNVWQSFFFMDKKSHQLSFKPDLAAIILHSIVPVLVILLAESAPRYRRRFSIIAEKLRDELTKLEGHNEGPQAPPAGQGHRGATIARSPQPGYSLAGATTRGPQPSGATVGPRATEGANAIVAPQPVAPRETVVAPKPVAPKPTPEVAPAKVAPADEGGKLYDFAPRGETQAAMREHWDSRIKVGQIPTGADLNRAVEKDPKYSLGKKYARAWRDALPAAFTEAVDDGRTDDAVEIARKFADGVGEEVGS